MNAPRLTVRDLEPWIARPNAGDDGSYRLAMAFCPLCSEASCWIEIAHASDGAVHELRSNRHGQADLLAAFQQGVPASVAAAGGLSMAWASDLRPRRVRWLWHDRLPLAAVSLLVGEGGLGKSQVFVLLTSAVSRGGLEGDLQGDPSTVLVATAEDAAEEVWLPRLIAAEADLTRIAFVAVDGDLDLPDDVERIRTRAAETGARLVLIDPLVAYIPSRTNTHRDQDVRRVMAALARVAEEGGLTIVGLLHLNKSESQRVTDRVGGSAGFVNAARSVLILGRDPEDAEGETGDLRVLAHAKSNYARLAPSLRMRVEEATVSSEDGDIPTSRVSIIGESTIAANDLVARRNPEETSAAEEAAAFLRDLLAAGPIPANEAKKAAEENGIAEITLNRTKRRMNVRSVRPGGRGPWLWALAPEDQPHEPEARWSNSSYASDDDHLDHLDHLALPERDLDGHRGLDDQGSEAPRARARAHEARPGQDDLIRSILALPGTRELTPEQAEAWIRGEAV